MSHASRDAVACRPTSCLKMSGQTVRRRRHATAALTAAARVARRPVVAARLARVHGWHASPHGGSGTFCLAAAAPRLDRLAAMPRLARHATPDGGSTPCPACFATGNYIVLILIHSAFLYILHIICICVFRQSTCRPGAAAWQHACRGGPEAAVHCSPGCGGAAPRRPRPVVAGRWRFAATWPLSGSLRLSRPVARARGHLFAV